VRFARTKIYCAIGHTRVCATLTQKTTGSPKGGVKSATLGKTVERWPVNQVWEWCAGAVANDGYASANTPTFLTTEGLHGPHYDRTIALPMTACGPQCVIPSHSP